VHAAVFGRVRVTLGCEFLRLELVQCALSVCLASVFVNYV